ncbi:MAG: Spy/CpxP family protein refolding chaperone [Syntrophaceae bacterium]|nr:Spy/CpxP family protein refolding chaperone [Syntrophaceae bacterium]
MKRNIKKMIVAFVVLSVMGIGFHHAYAARGDESSLTSMNPFLKRGYARLGLTDQQMTDIKAVVKKNLPELQTMTNQIIAERRVLKTLIRDESINEPAIRAQVAKLAVLGGDLCVRKAVIDKEIRAILTAEQLKKAKDARLFRERLIDRRVALVFKWFEE